MLAGISIASRAEPRPARRALRLAPSLTLWLGGAALVTVIFGTWIATEKIWLREAVELGVLRRLYVVRGVSTSFLLMAWAAFMVRRSERRFRQEIVRQKNELAAANERLAQEMAARDAAIDQLRHAERLTTVGRLAAGIAHEMGTPLNVISVRAKMIATGEASGDDLRASARAITEQSERVGTIIRQLLDYARASSAKKRTEDLRRVVELSLALLRPLAQKARVELELECTLPSTTLEMDAARMQQAVTNLVANAIQSMPQGGRVKLIIDGGDREGVLRLRIIDQGDGIPPEIRPRIFEPFFTTKRVGEGTGLGLWVTLGIVEEHHGEIEVESAPGRGTVFSITLPSEVSA